MKKLIVMAAVVCAAIVSQAATFRWAASGVQNAAGSGTYSGTATIYIALNGTTDYTTYTTTMTDGAFTFEATADWTAGKQYTSYYTLGSKDSDFFTSVSRVQAANATTTRQFSFGANGEWTKAPEPSPEPTSALLMLVGMAGLALRRRRA